MTATTDTGVSLLRLNILRAYYALIAFGTAAVFWPAFLNHSHEWGIAHGAQASLLAALSPLALLGLRHPLKMLPIIFYEFIWKALWFVFIVAPLHAADRMTDGVWANVFACSIAIILTPLVLPWRHVWHTYFAAAAQPWRRNRRHSRAKACRVQGRHRSRRSIGARL